MFNFCRRDYTPYLDYTIINQTATQWYHSALISIHSQTAHEGHTHLSVKVSAKVETCAKVINPQTSTQWLQNQPINWDTHSIRPKFLSQFSGIIARDSLNRNAIHQQVKMCLLDEARKCRAIKVCKVKMHPNPMKQVPNIYC